mgnify:CR=1 FL=1
MMVRIFFSIDFLLVIDFAVILLNFILVVIVVQILLDKDSIVYGIVLVVMICLDTLSSGSVDNLLV